MSTLYTQEQRQVGLLSQPSSLCGHLGITPLCMTCSDKNACVPVSCCRVNHYPITLASPMKSLNLADQNLPAL